MRQFVSSYKLKEAVLTFITIQMMNREDLLNLKESFKQMDKNGDGKLSSEELLITF